MDAMDTSIRLRITKKEKEIITEVAKNSGRTLSNWIRWVVTQAAANHTTPPLAAKHSVDSRKPPF